MMEPTPKSTSSKPLNPLRNSQFTSMFRNRNTALNFNLNQEEDEELEDLEEQVPTTEPGNDVTAVQLVEREPMFEKPLTPSDVGKLNRLVIPKQHAERHFPLGGGDTVEKGFLLSFEDELGKFWRFRYSYWNSSQSYVLTKGWSRFVKEKRLDAGDVVLFMRHRTDGGRLFIGWRRRAAPVHDSEVAAAAHAGGNGGWTRVFYSAHPYPSHPLPCQPHCLHAGKLLNQNPIVYYQNNRKAFHTCTRTRGLQFPISKLFKFLIK